MSERATVTQEVKPTVVPATRGAVLQRACACGKHSGNGGECAECRKKRLGLQRRAVAKGPDVAPPIVHEVLRSPGRPLDDQTRGFMESRFGHDFSGVRVHSDGRAAESARAVNALAYTVGNHLAFDSGQYAPGTSGGRGLLAHELAHVVQQGSGAAALQRAIRVGPAGDEYERRADQAAAAVMGGRSAAVMPTGTAPTLQRRCVGGRWQFEYDGCSLPKFVSDMLGIADKDNPAGGRDTQFAFGLPTALGGDACDRHDECYQTCNPLGKAGCDARMYADMVRICLASSEGLAVKTSCLRWAGIYYTGLRLGGDLAFIQRCLLYTSPSPRD